MLVTFIWIVLMRFMAGAMVWLSLFLTIGLLGGSTAYTWIKYSQLKDSSSETGISWGDIDIENPIDSFLDTYLRLKETWLAFFIISAVLLGIILLIVIFL